METARLRLRRFTPEDGPAIHGYLSDERVVAYEPYPSQTLAECQKIAQQRSQSQTMWAVCLKDSGQLIGNVYLAEQDYQNWEVGYVFHFDFQKQGYATEAVRELIAWAFAEEHAQRIFAQCNPKNTNSWRLLERLGFQREGHLRKNIYFERSEAGTPLWLDTLVYGLLEGELRG